MEEISEKLYTFSGQVVERLASDFASPEDRAKLFYVIMQEAGDLYASAWHNESDRILEIMKHTPAERVEKTKTQYKEKGGLPLNKVDHEFEKYFNKLVVITEKLISSPKSGLDKKIKSKP